MRVLVLGRGAREHALLWKLAQDAADVELFACPGNAGMSTIASCVDEAPDMSPGDYADLAIGLGIDLTVVGPEDLLALGVVDEFMARGLAVFGPTKAAARLETSKIWAKDLMARTGIPTAKWRESERHDDAREYARQFGWRCAVKFDGLASGKGTIVCRDEQEVEQALQYLVDQHHFGAGSVLVEELLQGQEVSVFAVSDGHTVVPFGAAQDHKRRDDGDTGPNTGGMGAYSPVTHLQLAQDFAGRFFQPIVAQLAEQGTPYVGVLYAGAILTPQGPAILEFNCRFGDPEAEVLLPRLRSGLLELLIASTRGTLHEVDEPVFDDRDAVCVVMAASDYPDKAVYGNAIHGIGDATAMPEVLVFHAGTTFDGDQVITDGGRILAVTALGVGIPAAKKRAYAAVRSISFNGARFRSDIAAKAIDDMVDGQWRKPPTWEVQVIDASRAISEVAQTVAYLEAQDPDRGLGHIVQRLVDIKQGLTPPLLTDPALLLPADMVLPADMALSHAKVREHGSVPLRERVRAYTEAMQDDGFVTAADALFATPRDATISPSTEAVTSEDTT